MTIEVIVKGDKRPDARIYRNRCNHCNSLLQFKASDGMIGYDSRDGDTIVIKCPECKSDVWTVVDAHHLASERRRRSMNIVKPLLATRFKLGFNKAGNCTTFRKDQAEELEGTWVWLIEATDGMNDPLFSAAAQSSNQEAQE